MNPDVNPLAEKVEALEAEIERLKMFEPSITRMLLENGKLDIDFKARELGALMADIFLAWLDAQGAKNYVEIQGEADRNKLEIGISGKEALLITIQRRAGKTPHQFRTELEAENARMRKALEYIANWDHNAPTFINARTLHIDMSGKAKEALRR